MRLEANIFTLPSFFFLVAGTVYGVVTGWDEWVGLTCILLSFAMFLMVGIYFRMLTKRHGVRAEDDDNGEIASLSGVQGVFAPWSWWPLPLAIGAAIAFLAVAVGWWLMVPAAVIGVVGLCGWVMEFSTGRNAH